MIYLDVDASTVKVSSSYPPDLVTANVALMEALKSKNPQAYMHNKKISKWGKPVAYWHEAFDSDTQTFPRGLLMRAAKALNDAKVEYQIKSVTRQKATIDVADWDALTPYDFQQEAVDQWIAAEFGMVVIPTRGGKTIVGCLAASAAIRQGLSVLWLVTKVEAQADVIKTWGREGDDLDVMTYKTATDRDLTRYGLVIADEAHRTAAHTYYDAIQGATNAWYRLGLTGTPKGRSDGKEIYIEGAVGPIIYRIPRSLLVERGICSSGKVWRLEYNVPVSMPDNARGNWAVIEKHGIVENKIRDSAFISAIRRARDEEPDAQVLVLCRRVNHAESLAASLSEAFGVEVAAMHSGRTKKQRLEVYKDFASGGCGMLVGTGIYDDSMTFPNLKVLAIAAGGKSPILTGQRLGRVLAGNKKITVIDSADNHWPTLSSHSVERFKVYEEEGCKVVDVNCLIHKTVKE